MATTRTNRRRFLLGAGGAALALPFLPSIMGTSEAAPPGFPKRFIFLFTSNGQRPNNWYPQAPQTWKALGQYAREAPLAGTGGISKILGSELDSHKSKLLLFRGLDLINSNGGGHNATTPLNGYRETQAVTIDQILAQSSKVYPEAPAVRSVHMLIKQEFQSPTSTSVSNLGGILEEIPHETSVAASYQRLFGTFVDDQDPLAAQRAALKVKTVDRVKAQYDALRKSPKLGTDDAKRLEAHVALLADLEARLGAVSAACTKPSEPSDLSLADDANLPTMTTMNIDLLVAALKCDRTRVATMMLCPGTDLRNFSTFTSGPNYEHHGLSHDAVYDYDGSAGLEDGLAYINNWYAKQVADLLTKLDVVEDPSTGATYLDNSIVYWGNEDGCNGFDAHVGWAMPVLLAGGAGGYFETGRYIDYRQITGSDGNGETGNPILYDGGGSRPSNVPTDFRGRPYNSLLISILEAMGLSPADWQAPGETGIGDYSGNFVDQYDVGAGQQPLPYLQG